ncbi:MAG: phytanoyl-CoA dioxygenase family protein [Planctomyces sp.]|nr:phytanoyl-CoA dioxygenase family protein [Planctomyces sp.]
MTTLKSQFQAVPDAEALKSLERDLRFHPTVNPQPKVLTAAQIEQFNRDGYLKDLTVFSPEEVTAVRAYFDELLSRTLASGADSYSISSAHLKFGKCWDLLTNARIVAYVRDLLGEDVVAWGSHFFCKMPGDGKAVAWHQDASYWPLSPSKNVTAWLAIDDADVGNGCMRFVAGSHHHGHMTFRESDPGEHNVLNQTIDNPFQYGHEVIDSLAAGQISIHSDLLLHGSEANTSTRRRCGLTLRYAAAEVRAALDWNQKGVLVSGQDASGHWANRPRPESDFPV